MDGDRIGIGPGGRGALTRAATATMLAAMLVTGGVAASSPSPAGTGAVVAASVTPEAALTLAWEAAPVGGDSSWGVALDPSGRVWATVAHSGMFSIHDPDGTFVETWGTPGDGDGELDFVAPWGNGFGGIAFRPDGGFYVADTGNVRVQEFDADRAFVKAWGSFGTEDGQLVAPVGIKLDGAGNVYVQDIERGDIQVFDADGGYLRTAVPATVPSGPFMAVDTDGNVYTVDEADRTLQRIRPDGSVEPIAELGALLSFATGIALLPSGGFLVASEQSGASVTGPEHLVELDASGDVLHVWPDGGWELAIDAAGEHVFMPVWTETGSLRALELPGA